MWYARWAAVGGLILMLTLGTLGLAQDGDCLKQLNPLARIRLKTQDRTNDNARAPTEVAPSSPPQDQGATSTSQPSLTPPPPTVDLEFDGLISVLYLLAYAAAGVVMVFVFVFIFKAIGRSRGGTLAKIDKSIQETPAVVLPSDRLPLTRTLVGGGDYRMALRQLLTATLRRLARRGLLEYNSAATDWEHLSALRVRGHLGEYDQLLPLARVVERTWYGVSQASDEDYRHALQRVAPLMGGVKR